MPLNDCVLTNGRFILPKSVLDGGALVIESGKIRSVLEAGEKLPQGLPRRDLGGLWVTPGLVELHIHGAGGDNFGALPEDSEAGAACITRAAAFLRSRGVTTFVPTIVSREASIASLACALETLGRPREEIPGIYVEGPFVNPAMRCSIPLDAICDPDSRVLGRMLNLARGKMALMTLAPELPGYREMLARLEAVGVLPCLGHSDCDIDRITLPSGKFSLTHLFNGMSPISHKTPGLAMLPFLDRKPFVELNADGVHVNEAALRICASALEPDKLMLISDAASGVLTGSRRLAPEILRNWLRVTGSAVENAVRMLTLCPAQALGIDDRRGAIAEGLDAVLVVWKGQFEEVGEILE